MVLHHVGSDPEFVAIRRQTGKPVAAPNVFKYTKEEPFVSATSKVFADNANIEVNIRPAKTADEFVANMRSTLRETVGLIGDQYELAAVAAIDYPKEELAHPYCSEFGCEPDYDAYQLVANEVAKGAAENTLRTCGAHIHLDLPEEMRYQQHIVKVIRAMDVVAGMASIALDDDPASVRRRTLYGKAGCFRPKEYGAEYRSLSNFWTRTPDLTKWAFNMSKIAVQLADEDNLRRITGLVAVPLIMATGDADQAGRIFDQVADIYPEARTVQDSVQRLTSKETAGTSLTRAWEL